jgi:hypothetical protein
MDTALQVIVLPEFANQFTGIATENVKNKLNVIFNSLKPDDQAVALNSMKKMLTSCVIIDDKEHEANRNTENYNEHYGSVLINKKEINYQKKAIEDLSQYIHIPQNVVESVTKVEVLQKANKLIPLPHYSNSAINNPLNRNKIPSIPAQNQNSQPSNKKFFTTEKEIIAIYELIFKLISPSNLSKELLNAATSSCDVKYLIAEQFVLSNKELINGVIENWSRVVQEYQSRQQQADALDDLAINGKGEKITELDSQSNKSFSNDSVGKPKMYMIQQNQPTLAQLLREKSNLNLNDDKISSGVANPENVLIERPASAVEKEKNEIAKNGKGRSNSCIIR